jgi:hypothetical protein
MMGSYSKVPGGDIVYSSFVKLDPSNTARVLQCGSGDAVFGIAGPHTRRIALDAYDTNLIGKLGDPAILIYGPADPGVLLQLGGTVANGDYLKPDASGFGVTAGTDKDAYGARALASGNSGDLIPVEVVIGERSK